MADLASYLNPTGNNLTYATGPMGNRVANGVTPQYNQAVTDAFNAASPQEKQSFLSMLKGGGTYSDAGSPNINNEIIGQASGIAKANAGSPAQNLLQLAGVGSAFAAPFLSAGGFFGSLGEHLSGIPGFEGLSGGTGTGSLIGNEGLDALEAGNTSSGVGSNAIGTGGAGADAFGDLGIGSNSLIGGATGASGVAGGLGTALSSGGSAATAAAPVAAGGFSFTNPLTISSLLGAGSSIAGNLLGAKQQTAAGNAANNRLQPYQETGLNANTAINNLIGNGPNGSAGIESTLENMPGYKFQRDQALLGVNNEGTALGAGSNTILKAGQTANNIAGTNYQNYFNNLMGLTNLGQSSAVQQGNNTIGIGNAQAGASVGSGNAASSAATTATLAPYLFGNTGRNFLTGQPNG